MFVVFLKRQSRASNERERTDRWWVTKPMQWRRSAEDVVVRELLKDMLSS